MMYQPWLRGCLLLLVAYSSAYVTPSGIMQPKSKLAWRNSRRPASVQSITCKLGRQQAMEDEQDAALTRRKLVMGATALATWIASGQGNAANAAIEQAFAATPVPTMPAPPTTTTQFLADEGKRLRGAILQGDIFNGALRYSDFMPKLYNMCKRLGFAEGNILPSRAFCSDENQLYPILQITKHFGTPPFDHGRVGGTVAVDRHGPHAGHGKDLVLIQASHVGWDPISGDWGKYRRLLTEDKHMSTSCGMVAGTLGWYQKQYDDACQRIRILKTANGDMRVRIPVDLLNNDRKEGLFLNMDKLAAMEPVGRNVMWQEFPMTKEFAARLSKASTNMAVPTGVNAVGGYDDLESAPIGGFMTADLFYFKKAVLDRGEPGYFLERHMVANIQEILTSSAPYLTAALCSSQLEFERTAMTLIKNPLYKGKKVMFVSGVNVDVSPSGASKAILGDTIFVPVAGMVMDETGKVFNLQQKSLATALANQPAQNLDAIDLETALKLTEKSAFTPNLAVTPSCGCKACVCPPTSS